MEHLARPIAACLRDLGNPDLTPKLQEAIIDGVLEEVGSRSLEQLGRERDELLLGLLRLRSKLTRALPKSQKVRLVSQEGSTLPVPETSAAEQYVAYRGRRLPVSEPRALTG